MRETQPLRNIPGKISQAFILLRISQYETLKKLKFSHNFEKISFTTRHLSQESWLRQDLQFHTNITNSILNSTNKVKHSRTKFQKIFELQFSSL